MPPRPGKMGFLQIIWKNFVVKILSSSERNMFGIQAVVMRIAPGLPNLQLATCSAKPLQTPFA